LPKEKRIRPFRAVIPLTATVEVPPKGGGGAWRTVAAAPISAIRRSDTPPHSALVRALFRHDEQRPRSSAAVGFVFGLIGFVFDFVKSHDHTRSCSNLKNLMNLRHEHVFPNLASFGAFRRSAAD
jgi:hypothetical protein